MEGLKIEAYEISDSKVILILDITHVSDELKAKIDEYIVEIWEGNTEGDICYVKKEILKYLGEIEHKKKIGAIAEFFIHLYLKMNGYNQYFLFQNLEEDKSFKKGFDGLYALENENWLMESKSTELIKAKHHSKISEAYNDLKNKVEGKSSNNPWKNAYNHANNRDIFVPHNVLKTLYKLRNEYTDRKYHSIGEFNIIPCSTKFTNELIEKKEETKNEVKNKIEGFEFNKIKAICINNKVADLFIKYLEK